MSLTPAPFPLILLCGVALCAVVLLVWKEARVAGRIITQFFLTIGLPIVVILGALVWLALPLLGQIAPQVGQAMIVGLVVAVGWLTTAIFAEGGKARSRAEKLRDYHKAIYAEIGNTLESLWEADTSDDYVGVIIERMRVEDGYVPFVPREHHDHVYNAVISEIDILPRQTIDAIVAYYSLIKSLAALADDMRSDTFRTLEKERQIAIYSDYVGMRKQAFVFGKYALRLILAYSKGGVAAAEKIINSPDAGRSATLRGSV